MSHQIASLVQNISASAREQTGVAAAITRNMDVLRDVSAKAQQSTTAASSSISKLSELASQLRQTVSGFALPDQTSSSGVLRRMEAEEGQDSAEDEGDDDDADSMDEQLSVELLSARAESLSESTEDQADDVSEERRHSG